MNTVEPYAKLLNWSEFGVPFCLRDGIELLRKIEWCGRISHASEDSQTGDSWKRFIEAVVLGKGDWSITEHATVSVDFMVDRGVTHELVRHRLFSFTQSSTRFINYAKKMPPSFIEPALKTDPARAKWLSAIASCEGAYRALLDAGEAPQIARSVFPNALASRIVATGNLRNWRHFFLMRCTKETHPQMRQVTIPLLAEFQSKIPLLYDDIVPMESQAIAIAKAR